MSFLLKRCLLKLIQGKPGPHIEPRLSVHAFPSPFSVYCMFTPNGKREFVPRDQVFLLIVVNCLLLQLKNKWFHASFIHKNCSGLFLSAYFLF